MNTTEIIPWLGDTCEGYVINTAFSDENAKEITTLINEIKGQFGDAVFCMPTSSLHMTLLDWIAPLETYGGRDKTKLFEELYPVYDEHFESSISRRWPIKVHFTEIRVAPSTIIIVGQDNGEFNNIRQGYLSSVDLIEGTKLPPTIIHSSIARFKQEIDLDRAKDFMAAKSIDFNQEVRSFRLVHTYREPMLEFKVIKEYTLEGK